MNNLDKKKYFENLEKVDKIYERVLNEFPVKEIEPINLEDEKKVFLEKFRAKKKYNPQIDYDMKLFSLRDFYKLRFKSGYLLHSERKEDDLYGFKELYRESLRLKGIQLEYTQFWRDKRSSELALKFWGKPSWFLYFRAKLICRKLKNFKVDENHEVSSKEVSNILSDEAFNLTKKVIQTNFSSKINGGNYDFNTNTLTISSKDKFFKNDIEKLKNSEIGVNLLRSFNGNKLGLKILERGSTKYLETEVGIGVYNQFNLDILSDKDLCMDAGRVVASYLCYKKNFYKIFKKLKSLGFNDDDAFSLTFESKKNLSDTSKKGGFSKNYIYLSGYFKVKKYAKRKQLKELFVGKVAIGELKVIKEFIKEKIDEIQHK